MSGFPSGGAEMQVILLAAAGIALFALLLLVLLRRSGFRPFETPARRAGRMGEEAAAAIIRSLLREGDILLRNVPIVWEGRRTELDTVVVNACGVFIIEVKNYTGRLVGKEEDYSWEKYKTTDAGNVYAQTVKNPIPQVKRQIHLLAGYLRQRGLDVWVEGYAILLQGNAPVKSPYLLTDRQAVYRAIHTPGRRQLSREEVRRAARLLKR